MPTYQYRCKEESCRHEFEAVQSFADPTLTECPVCGGSIAKVFSGVGISFKGGGFYTTDHGSRSKATSSEGSSSTASPSAPSPSAPSPSAPSASAPSASAPSPSAPAAS